MYGLHTRQASDVTVYKFLIIFGFDSSQLDFRMLQLRVRSRSKLPTTTVWPEKCIEYKN